ncbi:hypothetical protein L596_009467 [Steinernema carpocapsae]|uniref:Uncharacterized protein n=1 Tax=Steinernema carpocapsae TaxID=34508 RepID=A0A4U5PFY1_STECR|nr:hypothetical protein L596_009467 [Steinernema carpocapsae]
MVLSVRLHYISSKTISQIGEFAFVFICPSLIFRDEMSDGVAEAEGNALLDLPESKNVFRISGIFPCVQYSIICFIES